MDSPETVTEAVQRLKAEGYREVDLIDGHLVWAGGPSCAVDVAQVDRLFRFEGESDPGDEMIVFALRDPASGTRGVLASAFGSAADPETLDHLVGLRDRADQDEIL